MSLLRRTRAEVAGAWRSVRYDMGRRPVEPPAGGPDVTSTGMSTFGGPACTGFEAPRAGSPGRPRRRAAAVTALGMLTVLGAAGAYLGVVNGLGSLLHEPEAAAGTLPPQPAVTSTFTPNTGIGGGPAAATGKAPATTVAPDPETAPPPAAARNASPIRTLKPTNRICRCSPRTPDAPGGPGFPPVPTPTAPASAPSPTPSADPDPSTSEPDPDETSATPGRSAEPSDSPQARHRRRRR